MALSDDPVGDDLRNPGTLSLQQWNAGKTPLGQNLQVNASYTVMTSDGPVTLIYKGTGDTGGGGGSTRPMEDSGTGGSGTTTTPPPVTPNPLSGPSANGLPWYPNTYGLGPGMYASLQDQMAANFAQQYRDPFATNFERFNFSHGGAWDNQNTFGPVWGKDSNYDLYPLPPQSGPIPVTPPGTTPPPPPGTAGTPPTGGGAPASMNRNTGAFLPPRNGVPVGQMPAMRGSPNNPGGLLGGGTPTPTPTTPPTGRGTPVAEMGAMRKRPGTGLLGAQMIGSNAEDTVASGLLGTGRTSKALPTAIAPTANNAGMYPMAPVAGADAFRFANPATDAATNYNALASLSPQIAAQYLNTAGQAARPQLYDQAQGGVAQMLLNSGSAASGGLQGSSLLSTFANIPGFAGSPLAKALAKMPGGFNTYLSPADAAKLGLTPNTFGGALPNSNFYTVPLAK